jgi:hypothetical protein
LLDYRWQAQVTPQVLSPEEAGESLVHPHSAAVTVRSIGVLKVLEILLREWRALAKGGAFTLKS